MVWHSSGESINKYSLREGRDVFRKVPTVGKSNMEHVDVPGRDYAEPAYPDALKAFRAH